MRPSSSSRIRDSDTDIGRHVQKRVKLFRKYTRLDFARQVQEIEWNAFEGDRPILGRGAFADVFRVQYDGDVYALKRLNSVMPAHDKKFRTGACDLALEANILARLNHPNVIQLHGIKGGDLEDNINHRDFFLVLDYLTETLQDRINKRWRKEKGFVLKINKKAALKKLVERLGSALGVARGVQYLHSKNIIFRDLKPENVGYDVSGEIRLFDFGLARDLGAVERSGEVLGFTGTPRYMANEIGEGKSYGIKVDVYSFGVLLWQLCTLKDPFEDMLHIKQYVKWVVQQGRRPDLNLVKSDDIRSLIAACWDPDPERRPHFGLVVQTLERYLSDHTRVLYSKSGSLKGNTESPISVDHSELTETSSSRGSIMYDMNLG